MMNKMIVGNLAHRPVRSLISIVAVALEVTLILLIVGLCLGMINDSKGRQAGIGADVLVMPPGSSYIVGLTGAPMPIKIGDVLAKLPHVVAKHLTDHPAQVPSGVGIVAHIGHAVRLQILGENVEDFILNGRRHPRVDAVTDNVIERAEALETRVLVD